MFEPGDLPDSFWEGLDLLGGGGRDKEGAQEAANNGPQAVMDPVKQSPVEEKCREGDRRDSSDGKKEKELSREEKRRLRDKKYAALTKTCQVCGQPAGRHSYFGATACNSCRAFFRRTVQADKHPLYYCGWDGNCSIDSKSRKSCQKCRFEKCLAVGMKTSWVLTKAERESRHKVRTMMKRKRAMEGEEGEGEEEAPKTEAEEEPEVEVVELSSSLVLPAASPAARTPLDLFTVQESAFFTSLFEEAAQWIPRTIVRIKAQTYNWSGFLGLGRYFRTGEPLPRHLVDDIGRAFVQTAITTYGNLVELEHMDVRDKNLLLQTNIHKASQFLNTASLYSPAVATRRVRQVAEHILDRGRDLPEVAEHRGTLQAIIADTPADAPSLYNCMFASPWANCERSERRHRELIYKMGAWCTDTPDGAIDPVQTLLMMLIILSGTEDSGLRLFEPRAVEDMQAKYVYLLQRYLKMKYPRERVSSTLCGGLYIPLMVQESLELRRTRLPILQDADIDEVLG